MTVPLWQLVPFLGAAILLAAWRPRVALVLPLVLHAGYLIRSEIPLTGGVTLPTTLLELLIGVALLTAMGTLRGTLWRAIRHVPPATIVLALLFLTAATLSAFTAPHPRTGWGNWKAFVVEPMLYAVVVVLPLTRTAAGRTALARSLLLGGVVSASLSLAVAFVSLAAPSSLHPPPYTLDFGRLAGIYDVPNSLALVLTPLTAFAAALALGIENGSLRRWARWSLALFVPTLLLTQSLGGLVAALVGVLTGILASRNLLSLMKADSRECSERRRTPWGKRGVVVVSGAALFFAAGVGWQAQSGKLTHAFAENSPLVARLQIWRASVVLIRDHPLLGTGLGTFEPAYQKKLRELLQQGSRVSGVGSTPRDALFELSLPPTPDTLLPPLEWVVRDPHNVVLSFWLQTGLLGLLSMGSLVVFSLRIWWTSCRSSPTAYCLLPTASVGALATLLLFGLVDVPYLKNDLSLLWWVFLSSTVAAVPLARKNHRG